MRSWRNAIRTSPRPPGCPDGKASCLESTQDAPLVNVALMRHCIVFPGTVLRPSLRSPGPLVATTTPAALLALLAFLPPGPGFGQPSLPAGSSTPDPPTSVVRPTERPLPPPPLVTPGAAALLGGPEPLQIGGPEGAAAAPLAGPLAPLGVPVVPAPPPIAPPAPRPGGSQAPGPVAPGARPLTQPNVATPPPTTLVLDRRRRFLTVFENGRPLRRFPVAVGMPGWETPVGTFRVLEKTINPVWEHPQKGTLTPSGPTNPLGSRWIGFHQDCQGRSGWDGEQILDVKGCVVTGFHGTPNRWTVGRALSHGCVRLHDEDVRELFDLVTLGTPVTVLP